MESRDADIKILVIAFQIIAIPLGATFAPDALAGIRGESTVAWTNTSRNGRYIFVGIPKQSVSEQLAAAEDMGIVTTESRREELVKREERILKQYSMTGMYTNDGARKPLWTVGKWIGSGIPSDDGQKLVVLRDGAFNNDSVSHIATIYFANERVVDLRLIDVVPKSQQWIRSFEYKEPLTCVSADLDSPTDQLKVRTNQGDIIAFHLADGNVAAGSAIRNTFFIIGNSMVMGYLVAIVGSVLVGIVAWRFMSRSNPNMQTMKS